MALFTPCSAGCPVPTAELTKSRKTKFNGQKRGAAGEDRDDDWTDQEKAHAKMTGYWTGETRFIRREAQEQSEKPSSSSGAGRMSDKEHAEEARILAAIARGADITEVFSPQRVVRACAKFGLIPGDSMDLSTGYNFDLSADRRKAVERIRAGKPTLVIGSPPCTVFQGYTL